MNRRWIPKSMSKGWYKLLLKRSPDRTIFNVGCPCCCQRKDDPRKDRTKPKRKRR